MESCTPPKDSIYNGTALFQLKDKKILEGSEAHFKCIAEANPNYINYKWFINDQLVVGDYTTEMVNYY